jgi:1-acyl-sn-glycerol-3-phosphate acyltransferase
MRVAPKVVRRLLIAPAVVAVEAILVLLSPLVLLMAALVSPLVGGWRPLRAAVIALAFAARHMAAIVACLALWLVSGLGGGTQTERMQRAHYRLMRWFVAGLYETIVAVARVEVRATESAVAGRVLSDKDRPVVLLGRHAGEGDTLLALYELLCPHGREARIVMHERLRLDPLIDVLGDRLPNRFVDPRGGDTERDIAEMAQSLDAAGALVIFPEGRNFSAEHRQRAIERLERAGHAEQAEIARGLRHVSAPRPGGALAAIDAAPASDVIVMGHAGFPTGLRDVWRHLPERQTIEIRLWHEPAGAIPADRDARIDWLYAWWERIDAWVEERTSAAAKASS